MKNRKSGTGSDPSKSGRARAGPGVRVTAADSAWKAPGLGTCGAGRREARLGLLQL